MKITKDKKLVKTNISVWFSTNHLLSKFYSVDGLWKVKPKYFSRWFVENQTEILVLTNFTSLVIFNYLPPCLSFLIFLCMKDATFCFFLINITSYERYRIDKKVILSVLYENGSNNFSNFWLEILYRAFFLHVSQ